MKNALIAVAITALMGGLVIAPVTQQSAEAQVYSGLKSTSAPAGSELLTLVGHGGGGGHFGGGHMGGGHFGGGHMGGGHMGGGHMGGNHWAGGGGRHWAAAAVRTLLMEAVETGTAITEIRMATTIIGMAMPTTGPTTTVITAITGTAVTTPTGMEEPTPTITATAIARGSAVRR